MPPRYYIETYGCALAQYESLLMEETLRRAGYSAEATPENADVIIVNTCAVRLDTEQRIAERLHYLRQHYPGRKFVVAGCLAKARPGLIRRVVPEASLLAPQAAHKIVEAAGSDRPVVLLNVERSTIHYPRAPLAGRIATIMIQEGCRNKCSYCITKLSRGEPRSFPPRIIVEQTLNAVRKGAVEIRLTGTDTAAYGLDLPGKPTLADLVSMILEKVEGDYRIRIGMMTPEEAIRIKDHLLDVYRDERVYKFFHIPVQSGSDRVLTLMGRKYTIDEFRGLHSSIKAIYPQSLFATDIIVGHPGETEEDFEETVQLVRDLRFERVHLAQYSIRPHTRAASMPQVPDPVKKKRSTILSKLVEKIGREIYGSYIGKRVRVLITGESFRKNAVIGRMDNYFPVVIGNYSENWKRGLGNKWVEVLIIDASFFDLRGKIVG